tara:strand:- start:129 stop:1010 length:882 start_codon:yes stop_codon:yes gene_type:complete
MITTVILSKDRPAQLRLLLDSLQINGGNLFDITVLYDYTDDLFARGYIKTQNHFYNKHMFNVNFPIKWKLRNSTNINEDIYKCVSKGRDLCCLFNDENILFERVGSYRLIKKLFKTYVLSSLSLRLGNNTVIQNPYEREEYFSPIPTEGEFVFDKFLLWDATKVENYTNFSMPFSTNGHIYHKNILINALKKSEVKDPEYFEKIMQDNLYSGNFSGTSPLMASPEYSVVLHNSMVKLTETVPSNLDISIDTVNARYLKGNIIDYHAFDFTHVSKPYQDFTASFYNEDNLHNGG